jgi:hypothetical protein
MRLDYTGDAAHGEQGDFGGGVTTNDGLSGATLVFDRDSGGAPPAGPPAGSLALMGVGI